VGGPPGPDHNGAARNGDDIDAGTLQDVPGTRRAMTRLGRWRWIVGTAAVVVAVDQLTKWWARTTLDEPVHVIGSLQFNLAFNSGTAFSRFEGWGSVIGVVAIVVIAVLLRAGRRVASRRGALAMGAVIGGALGNLADRVFQAGPGFFGGRVTDFIDLQWWPIFNVADIGITVGGALLLWAGFTEREPAAAGEG
jgi:signal peptidase II